MTSVRQKLLVALLLAVVAAEALGGWLTYVFARNQLDNVFDYHLRQIALSLMYPGPDRVNARRAGPELDFSIEVYGDGVRTFLSRPDAPLPRISQLGYSTVDGVAGRWRIFAIQVGAETVVVGQLQRTRERLAWQAASKTVVPLALLLPVLALLVWTIVGRGLAPLSRLADAVTARTPDSLDPVDERGVPLEALPLVRSLNDLLERLRGAMAAQRAFVADAAHELRTPLAALKLQLQLAERAPEGPERAAALAELAGGLERGAHLVAQLLTLARQDPGAAAAAAPTPVSLPALVEHAVADHHVVAEAKGIDLGAARVDAAVVEGDPAALRTLLANLVDNAIRYTPAGGRVDVSAGLEGGAPFLEVADTGPGIPPAERERVFARFYRLPDAPAQGSGLGLSIVKAIADRHGAAVALSETPGGGLTARVRFRAGAARRPAA
ncbi:MAG TPA: ATP-binding protein [Anaeromyxobacter sp.]|nr:ATP-binding protein [Anaeromyxobacter sp.]